MVAPLRISREANSGHTRSSSGTVSPSIASTSLSVSPAPISTTSVGREAAQLGQPVDGDDVRRAAAAQVGLDAPVGGAGDHRRVGVLGQEGERVGEVGRAGEPRHPGRGDRGSRAGLSLRQRVRRGGGTQRPGRVADRAVAGAAAEVAADGVEVEAVGAVLRVGLVVRRAVGAVVLRGHRADEAGRAVAALRPAADRELGLDRVQVAGVAEPLGGDDLLAVEREGRHQAGVDRGPPAAVAVGPRDQHRAGAALALGAALLGPGQAEAAQEVERVGVGGHAAERPRLSVDGDLGLGHQSRNLACRWTSL